MIIPYNSSNLKEIVDHIWLFHLKNIKVPSV